MDPKYKDIVPEEGTKFVFVGERSFLGIRKGQKLIKTAIHRLDDERSFAVTVYPFWGVPSLLFVRYDEAMPLSYQLILQ